VGAFALAGAAAVLMIQLGQPQTPVLKRYSALAALVGTSYQHGSVTTQIRDAWQSKPVSPTTVEAGQLIKQYAPGGTPTAVLLPSQETPEVLLDADRRNAIPIAYTAQDFLVKRSVKRIFAATRKLPAGTVLITSRAVWDAAAPPPVPALASQPDPNFPVFGPLDGIGEAYQAKLALLIRHDYKTRVLGSSPSGLIAVRLDGPREASCCSR
jgi:hypothetical protein